MATISADGQYVVVVKGDTLWNIAKTYLGSGSKYKTLAAINNIPNPNLISVGQKIYLYSSPSPTPSATSSSSGNSVVINQFGLMANSDNILFATWTWDKENTASYKVVWTYDTGNGVWLVGNNSSITIDKDSPELSRQSTYTIPNGARKVRFKVKPISEKKGKAGKETDYWVAEWSTEKEHTDATPLATPGVPSVKIEKYQLTATLDGIAEDIEGIEFSVVRDNSTSFSYGKVIVDRAHAAYSCTVLTGSEYKVRCRAYKGNGSELSEWSAYSNNVGTMPAAPGSITVLRASSETSVYLEWEASTTAKTYNIEYTTEKDKFDISDQTTVKTGIENTRYDVSGLESGKEYFFRVKAVNTDGESTWSGIKAVVVGEDPVAPTTWSSTTTATTGEELYLYWIHNTADGSKQEFAELELYINGIKETYTFSNAVVDNSTLTYTPLSDDDLEENKTNSVLIKTSLYDEGSKIEWRVRTAGITKSYGDWSTKRTVDIYAPPTLALDITDINSNHLQTVTSFPFYISGVAGPKTQSPISYHLTIVSNSVYETTDNMGNERVVNAGEEVYSKYFDTFEALLVEFSAKNIDLENNISYTATCVVSMNSGLTTESSLEFSVAWTDMVCHPNAEISIDTDTLTAYIQPYCRDITRVCHKVTYDAGVYTIGEELNETVWGEPIRHCYKVNVRNGRYVVSNIELDGLVFGEKEPGLTTTTGEAVYHGVRIDTEEWLYFCYVKPTEPQVTQSGEEVYYGTTETGGEVYYCYVTETVPNDNMYLSVYRREFDGTLTEVASGLDSAMNTTVTDPHPALDYARYRIVAISKDTGSVSYYDMPGYPVGGKAAVIQWDETWSRFDISESDRMEQPPWSGSMLKLPYNIDVSESSTPDVALIEYIGRDHPIGYYGTQVGHRSNWDMEIEKSDKETLYALRRLQRWMGDVYVREPSGSGYWANITVSFSQKHCETTIPVALSVTRVEGGV